MNNLIGKTVGWVEDNRPMPDDYGFTEDSFLDMSLVCQRNGVIQAVTRTIFGAWVALIQVDGKLIERDLTNLEFNDTTKEDSQV